MLGNVAANRRAFRHRFEWYLAVKGAEEKNNKVKSSVFLHTGGVEEDLAIYSTFRFAKGQNMQLCVILS